MLKREGLNYFYKKAEVPSGSWKVFYDFEPSGSIIPSISGASPIYSGIPSNFTSGVFSGQNVRVSNANSLAASNWNMSFVFEKYDSREGILFSNYHGENPKSGFSLGVNSANRLFVETFSDRGPELHEMDVNLATRNAIGLSRFNNQIEFSYFDFNSKDVHFESFSISNNSFLPSNDWYIGAAINPPSYFSGKPFNGQIEVFTYITGSLFPSQKIDLFSGLTVTGAPEFRYQMINEDCSYAYLDLTGQISDITFNTIDAAITLVQTGYLINNTGQLWGNITGSISTGLGSASGYISGFLTQPSGYLVYNTGFVSGFSGYSTIGSGLRVFQNSIPSGVDNYFIQFPNLFNDSPVVFTELHDRFLLLEHKISGVSNSGFYISFSNSAQSDDYFLTSVAAPPQTQTDFKLFKTEIPVNTESLYVNIPNYYSSAIPKIFCQLENNSEQIFSYGVSEPSNTGFKITFSNRVEFPDVILHSLVTNLNQEDSFKILATQLTSGVQQQFINYPSLFPQSPLVFGEVTNASGENIISHQISGVTTSGFYALFSNYIGSNNYTLNSLSWSGTQSGVGYLLSTGKQLGYVGEVTDVAQNIYELSGQKDDLIITQYDLPVTRSIYATGVTGSIDQAFIYINGPVFVPISYIITLQTGQEAIFTHNILYENDGTNLIKANHTLNYSGSNIQPTPFTVYKTCYQNFGYQQQPYVYDSGYIYSFGMDGVHYLQEVDQDDLSEVYVFPNSHNKTNLNIDAIFDRSFNEFFTNSLYSLDNLNIYLNGLGLFGGGHRITGDIYNQGIKLDFDYLMTGNYILTNGFSQGQDRLVFDVIDGNRRFRNIPQNYEFLSGVPFFRNFNIIGYDLFLNGVKLVSGYHYLTTGNDIQILDSNLYDVSGLMFTLPKDLDFKTVYSGQFNYLETERFARGTSMLWGNGIRQNLDEQYLEVSKIGLLTGSRNFDRSTDVIFNNESLFWS